MLKRVIYLLKRFQTMQRIGNGLARAAAVRGMQPLDPADPATWEVSGLSQNGEDGITDYLTRHLLSPNRYFVEIGASDGTENNTSWLAIARRWRGVMVEGDRKKADYCRYIMEGMAVGVEVENRFVTRENIGELYAKITTYEPDFFSLDIDGIDWYIASALFELGFRPKIIAVEYNSCLGPENTLTIPYQPEFNFRTAHPTNLYYGVSIQAWRGLMARYGYKFVTVDLNGVNAFFVRPESFNADFFVDIKSREFEENFYQRTRHRCTWKEQFSLIMHLPLVDLSAESQ
ncbi:hypothetical protein BAC3_00569 [uncultured bacterium]|nr:hypothetical protein BAC3_00569 [uncultured bacterium]